MKRLIKDIRTELEKICPEHIQKHKKRYATKKEIDDFQKQSELIFPDDLVEFWLNCDFEITAGTDIYKDLKCEIGPSFFMFDEFEYLVEYWKENSGQGLDETFTKGEYYDFKGRGYKEKIMIEKVFDHGWFPIAIDSFDGSICVDMNPGAKGIQGQLLYMLYTGEGKSGAYDTGFTSFKEFLMHYLQLLKDRKIEIEDNIIYPLSHF